MNNYIIPICIEKYYIYDIFYNINNEIIIIAASEINPPVKIEYYDVDNNIKLCFNLHICPHNHTYIYTLKTIYINYIQLIINNDDIIYTQVNKYLFLNNEIIFSTIVKDEDEYIKQWIDFHFKLGVTKFIIYDNSNNDTLANILNTYILNKIVILFKWTYSYRLPISGISGQTTQQNHSIYAFNSSKYIGLFDIDEYVNIQAPIKIPDFLNSLILEKNIDANKISGFRLLNKFFYNPKNLPTNGNNFLKIYNCDFITKEGHEKLFVIPENVKTFSVHTVTDGLPMYSVEKNYAFFNHYYFLNKLDRGKNITHILDNSILIHI